MTTPRNSLHRLLAACFVLLAPELVAEENGVPAGDEDQVVVGEVVRVLEGDLIQVAWSKDSEERQSVRLYGLDAPETGQRFFSRAKEMVIRLAAGEDVQLTLMGKDEDGHSLARVRLGDGRELNQVLVRNGLAWWLQGVQAPDLERLERRARDERRGLWADTHPRPPWEFRQAQNAGKDDLVERDGNSEQPSDESSVSYWNQARRIREQAAREQAEASARIRSWGADFHRGVLPLQKALEEVLTARAEFTGLGESCRRLNLELIEVRQNERLMQAPERGLRDLVDRAVGNLAHMVRACQQGEDRKMGEYYQLAEEGMTDLFRRLDPYLQRSPP